MDLYHIQKWFTPFSREALEEHRSGSLLMTTINKENRIFEKESNRGCTKSHVLFVTGTAMLTGTAERETRGPRIDSMIYQYQLEASWITSK